MRALHVLQQHAALCLTESRTLLALSALFAIGAVGHQLRAEPLPYDEAFYLAGGAPLAGGAVYQDADRQDVARRETVPVQAATWVLNAPEGTPADSARAAGEQDGHIHEEPARVAGSKASTSAEQPRMNLNLANARLLTQLPGIGPKKAAAVVAYRDAHGAFGAVEDLQQVRGIGPKTVAKLAPLLFVEPPAEAASEQIAAN